MTDSSQLSNPENVQGNEKCKPANKKGKKKAKVEKEGKSKKNEKAGKTKSKKFHRRLRSLFCCCFKSQEESETEQTTTEINKTNLEDTSQDSFVTIDLNN